MGYPYGTVHGVAVGVTLWGDPWGGAQDVPMGRSMGWLMRYPYGAVHGVVNRPSLWGTPWGDHERVPMG